MLLLVLLVAGGGRLAGQPAGDLFEDPIQPTPLVAPGQSATPGAIPASNTGSLKVIVESVYERTPRQYSVLATRIELWIATRRLAVLDKSDSRVIDQGHRRLFDFEPIIMSPGYWFLTIRAYREGPLSRDLKWKAKTIQFGIHPGRETRVIVRLPFHVW